MYIVVRVLITVAILGCGAGFVWSFGRWNLRRLNGTNNAVPAGLERKRLGVPAILFFSSPACIPCQTLQRPTIEKLSNQYGEKLQVLEVSAPLSPDLADHWGVLSTPTTFVIDAAGSTRFANHGVAGVEKLQHQIQQVIQA